MSGIELGQVTLSTGEVNLSADGITLSYDRRLLDGYLAAIHVSGIEVRVAASGAPAQAGDTTLPELPPFWELVPADEIVVDQFDLHLLPQDIRVAGTAAFDKDSLRARLRATGPSLPAPVTLNATLDPNGQFDLALSREGVPVEIEVSGVPDSGAPDSGVPDKKGLLALSGRLDVTSQTLSLISEMAIDQAVSGTVTGDFNIVLPWPLRLDDDLHRDVLLGMALDISLEAALITAGESLSLTGASVRGAFDVAVSDGRLTASSPALNVALQGVTYEGVDYKIATQPTPIELSVAAPIEATDIVGAASVTAKANVDINMTSVDPDALASSLLFRTQVVLDMIDGIASAELGRGTLVDVVAPAQEGGIKVLAPLGVRWNTVTSTLSVTDAILQVVIPPMDVAGQRLHFRGVRVDLAKVTLEGSSLSALSVEGRLRTTGATEAYPVDFRAGFDLDAMRGDFTLSGQHRVSRALLAYELPGWLSDYDLDQGKLALSLAGTMVRAKGGLTVSAQGEITVEDGTAHSDETIASGINGRIPIRVEGDTVQIGTAAASSAGRINIATVNVGFPVTDIQFQLAADNSTARITNVAASVLGGNIAIDSLVYDIDAGTSGFDVQVADVRVVDVLALEGEDVVGSGILDGVLPVTLSNEGVSVDAGKIAARAPGGYLSYRGTVPSVNPGLDLAIRALRNFQYKRMDLEVNYTVDGALDLGVRLEGSSPDVENGRPIHFNLHINEDIPKLLESLRASEAMSERVQQRLSR